MAQSSQAARFVLSWLAAGILLLRTAAGAGTSNSAFAPIHIDPRGVEGREMTGEEIARQVCGACHVFPEPALLDRQTWHREILPRMETRLGIAPPDYSASPEGELLRSLGLYPDGPLIPKSLWDPIVTYYLTNAPETPLPQGTRPEIKVGLDQFEVVATPFRRRPALTTLVKIGAGGRLFVGDEKGGQIAVLDAKGHPQAWLALSNVPVSLVERPEGLYVTAIGSFEPSEIPRGALVFYERKGDGYGPPLELLRDLPRPTRTEFADFNGDGRTDLAMCLFGNHRGRFSWFENLGDDRYREHELLPKAGAIHCIVRDLNGDDTPDIAVLMAQESESLQFLINDGSGGFEPELVFQKHPVFGHNHFEFADFNGDGREDLLVVNGDNGEYPSPLKNYHGLRIYLNQGANRFEEAWFFPLNGATRAVARDFDEDGDTDIAAISFFPDYSDSPRESFVYFENRGDLKFSPATFPQCISGRWVAMDAGDLDEDGDIDIVLGSYIRGPGGPKPAPEALTRIWENRGPSILILRNSLRGP